MKYHEIINVKEDRSAPDLSHAADPLTDESVCGFGKYVGWKLKDIPIEYLEWMVSVQVAKPLWSGPKGWKEVMDWIRSKK